VSFIILHFTKLMDALLKGEFSVFIVNIVNVVHLWFLCLWTS